MMFGAGEDPSVAEISIYCSQINLSSPKNFVTLVGLNTGNNQQKVKFYYTSFPVIADSNDVFGSASASDRCASPGTRVTLIPTPYEGYVFKEWYVTSPEGLVISDDNTFIMPNEKVSVTAVFEEEFIPGPILGNPPADTENYIDLPDEMKDEALRTGSNETIIWDQGISFPRYIMQTLVRNPQLSILFKYTYEGKEYEIHIGPGKAVNDDVDWYGPEWLSIMEKRMKKRIINAEKSRRQRNVK